MRVQAAATATDLLDEDPRTAIVLAEISTDHFREARRRHPERVVNVGIMEATMVGVAAGFAMEGFHPVVHTITPFLVERPFEQLKLDFGYQGLGGTFVSTGASYDYATEGATHHGTGDVGVLLTIPGFEILVPGHPAELDRLLRETYANERPTYLRASVSVNRSALDVTPGRMEVVRRGAGATLIAVGPMLDRTVAAAEGLDVSVLYATSVAPFDASTLAAIAGEALAHAPARFASIGAPRRFPIAYGTPEEHDRDNGLDVVGIAARLRALL